MKSSRSLEPFLEASARRLPAEDPVRDYDHDWRFVIASIVPPMLSRLFPIGDWLIVIHP
ncbi:GH18725 [Drosophila grimshawi]|uniref:GH18725 n=1 Tax=Drosophila grimshawi TaxID=7222 RepID=B4JGN7_DROGR|nr:GH18725 [Drosophila grimshawi]